ncbi:hypothetical protein PQX77_011698 [Marasmius sp. AFHP31]|nr:hypothetical protein PQX77_011698 [Marasmius sp. AFHP31]
MSTYFSNAQDTTIGAFANFQNVFGNSTIIHNHDNSEREDRVTLRGRTVRRVIDGDIIFQRVLSSEILSVNVGTSTSTESQVVKVKKMEQTAKLYGYRGRFTATSFEPVVEKDRENFKEIVKVVLEAAMCGRSALLKQVFAVAESNSMTLIAHDELVNGFEFSSRYLGKQQIVHYYLGYTHTLSVHALRDDEALRVPVTRRYRDWLFNLQTLSWHYNPASLCLDPPNEGDLKPLLYPVPPLCQDSLRQLNANEIVACFEKSLGDALYLTASMERRFADVSNYARHGLLTFGAVVDRWEAGILAHLPSTPSPEWFCQGLNRNVKAGHSSLGRVDLSFQEIGDIQVIGLDFGWRIPGRDRVRLECAFLCQSHSFGGDFGDLMDVAYIDQVGFRLIGTFRNNPTSQPTPAYLFVQRLPAEYINGVHCVHYPFSENLFYWSHDQKGGNAIAEEDWEQFGIPKLRVEEWIGSSWDEEEYKLVRNHLHSKDYELDGKQYARDHGHPELIFADPHDNRTTMIRESVAWSKELELELKHLGLEPKTLPSPSQLAIPSPSSVGPAAPIKCDTENPGDMPTLTEGRTVTHWAKPVFLKWYNSVLETLARADALDHSVVAC